MALDEAVLDQIEPETLVLRLYRWRGPAPYGLTLGYFQPLAEAAALARSAWGGLSLPAVRRLTGGGTALHDGDVTFSFVFPWPRLLAPGLVYKNLHVAAHLGLKAHGAATRLWSPGPRSTPPVPAASCFAGPAPMDLVREDGTKLLGGALRRRRGSGLYQGSLRPEGLGLPPERIARALAEGFSLQHKALFEPRPVSAALAAEARRLVEGRYSTQAWNGRR